MGPPPHLGAAPPRQLPNNLIASGMTSLDTLTEHPQLSFQGSPNFEVVMGQSIDDTWTVDDKSLSKQANEEGAIDASNNVLRVLWSSATQQREYNQNRVSDHHLSVLLDMNASSPRSDVNDIASIAPSRDFIEPINRDVTRRTDRSSDLDIFPTRTVTISASPFGDLRTLGASFLQRGEAVNAPQAGVISISVASVHSRAPSLNVLPSSNIMNLSSHTGTVAASPLGNLRSLDAFVPLSGGVPAAPHDEHLTAGAAVAHSLSPSQILLSSANFGPISSSTDNVSVSRVGDSQTSDPSLALSLGLPAPLQDGANTASASLAHSHTTLLTLPSVRPTLSTSSQSDTATESASRANSITNGNITANQNLKGQPLDSLNSLFVMGYCMLLFMANHLTKIEAIDSDLDHRLIVPLEPIAVG